jgi:hypothetical protein
VFGYVTRAWVVGRIGRVYLDDMGRRSRNSWSSICVQSIYRQAKSIRDGTHVPAEALGHIGSIAEGCRRRRPDGTLEPYEESWLWPIYAPFHRIRMRWMTLKEDDRLTPELADELQVEMYEAAYALLGEPRRHRPLQGVAMYEQGRLRTDRPEAIGMSNFIIGQISGRLPSSRVGTRITVSNVHPDPVSDLDV